MLIVNSLLDEMKLV